MMTKKVLQIFSLLIAGVTLANAGLNELVSSKIRESDDEKKSAYPIALVLYELNKTDLADMVIEAIELYESDPDSEVGGDTKVSVGKILNVMVGMEISVKQKGKILAVMFPPLPIGQESGDDYFLRYMKIGRIPVAAVEYAIENTNNDNLKEAYQRKLKEYLDQVDANK